MNLPFLAYVAIASVLIPPAAGLYRWKTQNTPMKLFAVLCVYSLIHTVIEITLAMKVINNHFLSHYHTIIEFEVIVYLYSQRFSQKILRDIALWIGVLFVIFWIYNKIYFEDPQKFDDLVTSISQILLIVLSVMILQNLFRDTSSRITQYSTFWIASATILYCSGTIIIMTMSNRFLEMDIKYFWIAWHFNWAFTIIGNLLYTRSFLCKTY